MLIECPFCHARAKISENQEGAKVRCGNCSKLYVARTLASRRGGGSSSGSNTGLMIGVGVGIVALIVIAFAANSGKGGRQDTAAAETDLDPLPPRDPQHALTESEISGWDSEPVRVVRDLHQAAYLRSGAELSPDLHVERIWAEWRAGLTPEEQAEQPGSFELLTTSARHDFTSQVIDGLTAGEGRELVALWKPYDGEVLEQTADEAHVRVVCSRRDADGDTSTATIDWHLAEVNGRWRAFAWERHITEREATIAAVEARQSVPRDVGSVELSDGSRVYEAEPRVLGHLEDTPEDVRARIDTAAARMIDFDLRPRENNDARDELVALGKPAIPILLTQLHENPLASHDDAARATLTVTALREITGVSFGFKPQTIAGSGTGTTEELQRSAIRQWFAWWARRGAAFTERAEGEDALDDLIDLDERDEAWLERNKDR